MFFNNQTSIWEKILKTLTNLEYITELNIKYKTIKLLKENIGENLCDIDLGKDFLYKA